MRGQRKKAQLAFKKRHCSRQQGDADTTGLPPGSVTHRRLCSGKVDTVSDSYCIRHTSPTLPGRL